MVKRHLFNIFLNGLKSNCHLSDFPLVMRHFLLSSEVDFTRCLFILSFLSFQVIFFAFLWWRRIQLNILLLSLHLLVLAESSLFFYRVFVIHENGALVLFIICVNILPEIDSTCFRIKTAHAIRVCFLFTIFVFGWSWLHISSLNPCVPLIKIFFNIF